ncbi:hypothetical protein M422DRAFT_252523 [Sphaerobolus stellatus SS14]|uniref:Uncharacterized protein n=1 Tax=Sphaerobolus stellatus (strain SS14) TaxID=990650 RepID=A0A0C9ULV7_SPHS4|nr:hypothetical protein M422DRAFT_252523 [Sphaerobolus stellatus SS14]
MTTPDTTQKPSKSRFKTLISRGFSSKPKSKPSSIPIPTSSSKPIQPPTRPARDHVISIAPPSKPRLTTESTSTRRYSSKSGTQESASTEGPITPRDAYDERDSRPSFQHSLMTLADSADPFAPQSYLVEKNGLGVGDTAPPKRPPRPSTSPLIPQTSQSPPPSRLNRSRLPPTRSASASASTSTPPLSHVPQPSTSSKSSNTTVRPPPQARSYSLPFQRPGSANPASLAREPNANAHPYAHGKVERLPPPPPPASTPAPVYRPPPTGPLPPTIARPPPPPQTHSSPSASRRLHTSPSITQTQSQSQTQPVTLSSLTHLQLQLQSKANEREDSLRSGRSVKSGGASTFASVPRAGGSASKAGGTRMEAAMGAQMPTELGAKRASAYDFPSLMDEPLLFDDQIFYNDDMSTFSSSSEGEDDGMELVFAPRSGHSPAYGYGQGGEGGLSVSSVDGNEVDDLLGIFEKSMVDLGEREQERIGTAESGMQRDREWVGGFDGVVSPSGSIRGRVDSLIGRMRDEKEKDGEKALKMRNKLIKSPPPSRQGSFHAQAHTQQASSSQTASRHPSSQAQSQSAASSATPPTPTTSTTPMSPKRPSTPISSHSNSNKRPGTPTSTKTSTLSLLLSPHPSLPLSPSSLSPSSLSARSQSRSPKPSSPLLSLSPRSPAYSSSPAPVSPLSPRRNVSGTGSGARAQSPGGTTRPLNLSRSRSRETMPLASPLSPAPPSAISAPATPTATAPSQTASCIPPPPPTSSLFPSQSMKHSSISASTSTSLSTGTSLFLKPSSSTLSSSTSMSLSVSRANSKSSYGRQAARALSPPPPSSKKPTTPTGSVGKEKEKEKRRLFDFGRSHSAHAVLTKDKDKEIQPQRQSKDDTQSATHTRTESAEKEWVFITGHGGKTRASVLSQTSSMVTHRSRTFSMGSSRSAGHAGQGYGTIQGTLGGAERVGDGEKSGGVDAVDKGRSIIQHIITPAEFDRLDAEWEKEVEAKREREAARQEKQSSKQARQGRELESDGASLSLSLSRSKATTELDTFETSLRPPPSRRKGRAKTAPATAPTYPMPAVPAAASTSSLPMPSPNSNPISSPGFGPPSPPSLTHKVSNASMGLAPEPRLVSLSLAPAPRNPSNASATSVPSFQVSHPSFDHQGRMRLGSNATEQTRLPSSSMVVQRTRAQSTSVTAPNEKRRLKTKSSFLDFEPDASTDSGKETTHAIEKGRSTEKERMKVEVGAMDSFFEPLGRDSMDSNQTETDVEVNPDEESTPRRKKLVRASFLDPGLRGLTIITGPRSPSSLSPSTPGSGRYTALSTPTSTAATLTPTPSLTSNLLLTPTQSVSSAPFSPRSRSASTSTSRTATSTGTVNPPTTPTSAPTLNVTRSRLLRDRVSFVGGINGARMSMSFLDLDMGRESMESMEAEGRESFESFLQD